MTNYIKKQYLPTSKDAHERLLAHGHKYSLSEVHKKLGGHYRMGVDWFYNLITAYDLGPQEAYLWVMELARMRIERKMQDAAKFARQAATCEKCGKCIDKKLPDSFPKCEC